MAKSVPPGSADYLPKKRAPRKPPTSEIPPDDLHAVFGRNLRLARLKSGLTLIQVAETAGITFQHLSRIENGKKNVTLEMMKKLAAVIDHDVSGMLRLAHDETESPSQSSKNKVSSLAPPRLKRRCGSRKATLRRVTA